MDHGAPYSTQSRMDTEDIGSVAASDFLDQNFSFTPKLTLTSLGAEGAEGAEVDQGPPLLSEMASTQSKKLVSASTTRRNSSLAINFGSETHISKANARRARQPQRRFTAYEPLSPLSTAHSGKDGPEVETGKETLPRREEQLRRNKIAASRCRKNKKVQAEKLKETKDELEQQNMSLQMEYKALVDEVHWMKSQVMAHAGCNNSNIDKWIKYEARKAVAKTSQRHISRQEIPAEVISFDWSTYALVRLRRDSEQTNPFSIPEAPFLESSSTSLTYPETNYDHMPDEIFGLEG